MKHIIKKYPSHSISTREFLALNPNHASSTFPSAVPGRLALAMRPAAERDGPYLRLNNRRYRSCINMNQNAYAGSWHPFTRLSGASSS